MLLLQTMSLDYTGTGGEQESDHEVEDTAHQLTIRY